jgi:hypothetical protein
LSLNPASLVERHRQIAHALADGMGDRVRDCRRSSDNADLRTRCAHSSSWIAATPLPRSSRRRSSNSRACGNATLHVCVKRPCRRSHLLRSIQKRLRSKNGAGRTRLRYVGTSWPRHPSFHHLMRRSISSFAALSGRDLHTSKLIPPKQMSRRWSRTCCTAVMGQPLRVIAEGWSQDVSRRWHKRFARLQSTKTTN